MRQYREIAALSTTMLEKALDDQWDELIGLGAQYRQAIEGLKGLGPADDGHREERHALLRRILDNDARIRALAAPELHRLGQLIGEFKRQRAVIQAYGGAAE